MKVTTETKLSPTPFEAEKVPSKKAPLLLCLLTLPPTTAVHYSGFDIKPRIKLSHCACPKQLSASPPLVQQITRSLFSYAAKKASGAANGSFSTSGASNYKAAATFHFRCYSSRARPTRPVSKGAGAPARSPLLPLVVLRVHPCDAPLLCVANVYLHEAVALWENVVCLRECKCFRQECATGQGHEIGTCVEPIVIPLP